MARTNRRPGPGRKNLGPRDQFMVRVSVPLGEWVREQAEQQDMDLGPFIATLVANAAASAGRTDLLPPTSDVTQEELPLGQLLTA